MKKIILGLLILSLAACSISDNFSNSTSLHPYLDAGKLLELTQNPDPGISIIDLRSAEAYSKGHIASAINIPSSEIFNHADEINKLQYLIFYCESGGRSHWIIEQLRNKGFTRMLNWGSYKRWPYELQKL